MEQHVKSDLKMTEGTKFEGRASFLSSFTAVHVVIFFIEVYVNISLRTCFLVTQ